MPDSESEESTAQGRNQQRKRVKNTNTKSNT